MRNDASTSSYSSFGSGYAKSPYVALAVLFAVNVLNTIDRNLLVVLNEPIKRDFLLTDGQVGLNRAGFAGG